MMTAMPRHRVLTPLRWSDMDAYGHVNNVQYLRLIEDARVVAFAAKSGDDSSPLGDGSGSALDTALLVGRAEVEYLEPLVYRPAPVAIDMWITRFGGASFDLGYEVLDDAGTGEDEPVIYARAETTMVVYDLAGHRPRRITLAEREHLSDWVDEPVTFRRSRHR